MHLVLSRESLGRTAAKLATAIAIVRLRPGGLFETMAVLASGRTMSPVATMEHRPQSRQDGSEVNDAYSDIEIVHSEFAYPVSEAVGHSLAPFKPLSAAADLRCLAQTDDTHSLQTHPGHTIDPVDGAYEMQDRTLPASSSSSTTTKVEDVEGPEKKNRVKTFMRNIDCYSIGATLIPIIYLLPSAVVSIRLLVAVVTRQGLSNMELYACYFVWCLTWLFLSILWILIKVGGLKLDPTPRVCAAGLLTFYLAMLLGLALVWVVVV